MKNTGGGILKIWEGKKQFTHKLTQMVARERNSFQGLNGDRLDGVITAKDDKLRPLT